MNELPEQCIALSRGKNFLLFLAGAAFVAIGMAMMLQGNALMALVGLLSAAFFGAASVIAARNLYYAGEGLIVNLQGLVDRSSGVSAGFVPWADVAAIQISLISGQKFVSLQMHEPEKYARRGNALVRLMNHANIKLVGTPVNISANSLRISLDELLAMLQTYHRAAQAPSS